MANLVVTRRQGRLGVYSWSTGFVPAPPKQVPLELEARFNLEAVINRLFLQGRYDEAERLFDRYA
jgi:hypothetical protein